MSASNIFKQGAEGRLYVGEFKGEKCLVKERFVKKYRHPELDSQITRQRMKAESKAFGRCQAAGILSPKILHMDLNERKIFMEYFEKAITAKEFIQHIVAAADGITERTKLLLLCERIGTIIGKLHENHLIHGDLTTSNILIDPITEDFDEYQVVLVDFGLSYYNQSTEDKGVDLYVLERALLSTHSQQTYLFDIILESYRKHYTKDERAVVSKFEEVRARGRKRTLIG